MVNEKQHADRQANAFYVPVVEDGAVSQESRDRLSSKLAARRAPRDTTAMPSRKLEEAEARREANYNNIRGRAVATRTRMEVHAARMKVLQECVTDTAGAAAAATESTPAPLLNVAAAAPPPPAQQQQQQRPRQRQASASPAYVAPSRSASAQGSPRTTATQTIQHAWRGFCQQSGTTRQLCQAFMDTGIPFGCSGAADRPSLRRMQSCPAAPTHPAAAPGPGPSTPAPPAPLPQQLPPELKTDEQNVADALTFRRFDALAGLLQRPGTVRATSALLSRLEAKLRAKDGGGGAGGASPTTATARGVETLLQQVMQAGAGLGGDDDGGDGATGGSGPLGAYAARYPARLFLGAYAVRLFPEVTSNHAGPAQDALTSAADALLGVAEQLLLHFTAVDAASCARCRRADGDEAGAAGGGGAAAAVCCCSQSAPALLLTLDTAWAAYLRAFLAWRAADTAAVEAELIRAAVAMETSMLCKVGPQGTGTERVRRSPDLQALVEQVSLDHGLIRERLVLLGPSGGSGALERLDSALSATQGVVEAVWAEQAAAGQAAGQAAGGAGAADGRAAAA